MKFLTIFETQATYRVIDDDALRADALAGDGNILLFNEEDAGSPWQRTCDFKTYCKLLIRDLQDDDAYGGEYRIVVNAYCIGYPAYMSRFPNYEEEDKSTRHHIGTCVGLVYRRRSAKHGRGSDQYVNRYIIQE